MRKLLASLFISLDGVVESPDRWRFDAFDEDMLGEMTEVINGQDAVAIWWKQSARCNGNLINVAGSPALVQSLLENDLLDELRLQVHPVIVGRG